MYTYMYTYICIYNGGGGPGFNPHHVKLSGLEGRPLKVSGGSPVHLRSKHQELVGKTLWVKKKEKIYIMNSIHLKVCRVI